MDEFGVLVESIGFRAHGARSAPIAKSKSTHNNNNNNRNTHTTKNTSSSSFVDDSSFLPVDALDGVFRSSTNSNHRHQSPTNMFGVDDLESVLLNNNHHRTNAAAAAANHFDDDLFGLNSKPSASASAVDDDDLFGNFVTTATTSSNVTTKKKVVIRPSPPSAAAPFDPLIPGLIFDDTPPPPHRSSSKNNNNNKLFSEATLFPESNGHSFNSSSPVVVDDPFLVFESSVSQSHDASSWPFDGPSQQDIGKSSAAQPSTGDAFDDVFNMGGVGGAKVNGSSNGVQNVDDLDAIFGNGVQQNSRPTTVDKDSIFGEFFQEQKRTEVSHTASKSSFTIKKPPAAASVVNDYASIFGDVTTSSGEFQEIDGEPADRRRARLNRHMRTNARMAEALAEKNQRDFQSQLEQEEKCRFAETLDYDLKRWAAGKEGNLRALLSSLQQILWPECGWRPVSLTDMITSDSVKKVYKKATLYVHPDKVQQKGANAQQKYLAEKVFDLLKEAWNKFSSEELR